jgi:hypothetical protein
LAVLWGAGVVVVEVGLGVLDEDGLAGSEDLGLGVSGTWWVELPELAEEGFFFGIGVGEGGGVELAVVVVVGEVDDADLAELGDGEVGDLLEGFVELEGGEEDVGGVGEDAEAAFGGWGSEVAGLGLGAVAAGDLLFEPGVQLG